MVSINFKIMNKNAQLNMAYSAFRDDRAAKKKMIQRIQSNFKFQYSTLNCILFFLKLHLIAV